MMNELESAIVEWVSKTDNQYRTNVVEVFYGRGYPTVDIERALDKLLDQGPLYLNGYFLAFKFPEENEGMSRGGFDKQQMLDYVSDDTKKLRDLIVPKYIQDALAPAKQTGTTVPAVEHNDPVHSPSHYTRGGIEVIDFVEAKGLNFHLGNVVKYVSRAGFKQDAKLQDLEKALWYLTREIKRIKTQES